MNKVCGAFRLEEKYINDVDGETEGNTMLSSKMSGE
jgi:hypothetical protein